MSTQPTHGNDELVRPSPARVRRYEVLAACASALRERRFAQIVEEPFEALWIDSVKQTIQAARTVRGSPTTNPTRGAPCSPCWSCGGMR